MSSGLNEVSLSKYIVSLFNLSSRTCSSDFLIYCQRLSNICKLVLLQTKSPF